MITILILNYIKEVRLVGMCVWERELLSHFAYYTEVGEKNSSDILELRESLEGYCFSLVPLTGLPELALLYFPHIWKSQANYYNYEN